MNKIISIVLMIILTVLLGAGYFRWDYRAQKTTDTLVVKWKMDRWTGQMWRETYRALNTSDEPLKPLVTGQPHIQRELIQSAG